MDGELLLSWNALFGLITRIGSCWQGPRARRGHPDEYATADIVLCWLWSGLVNRPLATAMRRLGDPVYRRGMRTLGYRLPRRCPHETTLRRRARRGEFWAFVLTVNLVLIGLLAPRTDTLLIDSTLLAVPHTSRDRQATHGHHGQRGYRWHTLVSADRVILQAGVYGANVHELAAAPVLVRQAAGWGWRCRRLGADTGYDSEAFHRCVREELGGVVVAPLNDRGGRRALTCTPLRARLNARWRSGPVQRVLRRRTEVERMYSVLKSGRFNLYALPPWVRGLAAVERWVTLKTLLYHGDLLTKRRLE